MGHSLCSFILRHIPRRSPTHNAVYFTTTRLGGYTLLTSEQVKEATKLNDIGHLFHYPSAPNADSFDVNIIVGCILSSKNPWFCQSKFLGIATGIPW